MGAFDEAFADEVADGVLDGEFFGVVELRRRAGFAAVDGEEVVGRAEFVAGFADEEDDVTLGFEGLGGDVLGFFDEADHADGGRGVDGSGGGFVVEAHIAAGDGCVECAAGFGEAFDGFAELEEIFGFVWIAEIQVVRDGERGCASAGDVARGFGDGDTAAFAGILFAVDRVAIGGCSEDFVGLADDEDGCIRAGQDGGAEADHVVVLLPDPLLGGDARMGEEGFESGERVGFGHAGEVEGLGSLFWSGFAGVEWGFVGKLASGDFDGDFVTLADAHHAVVVDHADMGVGEIPFFKDGADFVFLAFFDDDEHAFLGLGEQDFVGRHAGLAFRHEVDIDFNACAATAGGFAGRAGEACGAHVLDASDAAAGEEFEAGFEEEFFAEGVADLHGGAVFLGFLGEFAGGEGGSGEAITAGFGSDIENWIAHALGGSAGDLLVLEDAEAEDIDERISRVAVVEIHLAANGRNADAISVVGDAIYHSCEEAAVGGGLMGVAADVAEAERIHREHRAGTHGEDVANDAADACGRALEWFDGARVVVALHFECDGPSVADVDDAGIFLARLHEHAGAGDGEFFQLELRIFVGAMLTPHDGENAEFGEVRLASEDGFDAFVFVGRNAVFGDDFGCDGGHIGRIFKHGGHGEHGGEEEGFYRERRLMPFFRSWTLKLIKRPVRSPVSFR